MLPRERFASALNHEEPDRAPVDLGSHPSSGISAIAYSNLKEYLGISGGHTRVYDVVQQLAQPEDDIIERFGVDVVDVGRTFNTSDEDWYEMELPNGDPAEYPQWFRPELDENGNWKVYSDDGDLIAKMPKNGYFFDQKYFPYVDGYPDNYDGLDEEMDKVLWQALVHSPWDNMEKDNFWEVLRNRAIKLREDTDYAIMLTAGGNLFEWGTFLRRMDNFLMDLVRNQDEVARLLDELVKSHISTLEKVTEYLGDVIDVIRFGDDLGDDSGPIMPPKTYRQLFKPRQKELVSYVKDNSDLNILLHSDGSIFELIPDLIEVGFDAINPLQTNTKNMEPKKLKREFGQDIAFWGAGVDTREVLNKASPEKVKRQVKENLEILTPGGGFIFAAIHNILPEVPPENIVAMFEAYEEFYQ